MATLASGCLFSKRASRTKESPAIATEIEEGFRRRWMEQRVTQLVAQGTPADVARTQSAHEFRERYGFIKAGQK